MWSTAKFAPKELIEIAVNLEERGTEFYQELAALAENLQLQNLFEFLAQEEKKHKSYFESLGADFMEINLPESYDDEYKEYILTIVESHVINNSTELIEKIKRSQNGAEAIDLAINFEKDSILCFNSFRQVVTDKNQKVLNNLIDEEKNHLVKLSKLKRELR